MARPRSPESSLSPDSLQINKRHYIARRNEPKTAGQLGAPSRWLSKEQKKIWRELVKNSPAVLGGNDRTLLQVAVVLKSKLEAGTIENAQIAQLLSVLSKLGMVPKERTSSQSDDEKEKSEWDDL